MANLKDAKASGFFHGLIYGESGVGKTSLIGTFPDPYIISTDYNLEPLYGMDVEYDQMYGLVGDAGAKDIWPALMEKVDAWVKSPEHETFALDSLTTVADVVVAHELGKVGRKTLQLQDYNSVYAELMRLVVKLRKMPCNSVLTAHEETSRDDLSGKIKIFPLVIGNKFAPKLPMFFTNVYNAIVDIPRNIKQETERYLLVQPDGTRLAKTQARNTDMRITKSHEAIMEHINKREES